MTTSSVLVSYSHQDEIWKNRLRPHLGVLEQFGPVRVWDDRRIDAGADWYDELRSEIDKAAVTICLISADYLASEFCVKEEIPYLLERRERDGMILIPVLLRPCVWQAVPWLTPIQMLPRDGKSISVDFNDNGDTIFADVATQVFKTFNDPAYQPPAPPPPAWLPPEKIDIERLPQTGAALFGRQQELALLDEAWDSAQTHVVSFVAWGGVGKSTLINKWLEQMALDNYRGAVRVFGWSFYSQGTSERVTSADEFMAAALAWFGDPDPTLGSAWDKGQRLADLVRQQRTLLLLDGMEPLQEGADFERGKVKDPALAMLLAELARRNPGLAVITTRQDVADLAHFTDTVQARNLEQISDEAGRALLRVGGVRGTDADLEATTSAFDNHALALNLLAAYLHDIPGHPVAQALALPDLDVPVVKGKHPRRVMAAFAARFGDGPELDLLHLLGLYDRPAGSGSMAVLRAAPAIPGLTEHIQSLNEGQWLHLLNRLRQCKLLAAQSSHRPDALDTHPLVREHFGEQLQSANPAAWRAAHSRLYEYYKEQAPYQPDTLEEIAPLYAAVAHGCQAGRHQEALMEVYWQRIQRGDESYNTKKLGALSSELAVLSGFFDPPWHKPVSTLAENLQAFILNEAGFDLRALGRLAEAAQPMQAALEISIRAERWDEAARQAGNLSELALTVGDVAAAVDYAEQAVALADRSGDAFRRIAHLTDLANALHQAGRLAAAAAAFQQAEALQAERQPQFPLLYSLRGYQYCGLLLAGGEEAGRGGAGEARRRAEQTLEWARQYLGLLDAALDHLTLGQAHLQLAQHAGDDPSSNLALASSHLNAAVAGLRQAGRQDYLPRALLARVAFYRLQGALAQAQRDVDEALEIATRGGMRLHEADGYLELTRLRLAQGQAAAAMKHLARAKAMIEEMGYARRLPEVAALENR